MVVGVLQLKCGPSTLVFAILLKRSHLVAPSLQLLTFLPDSGLASLCHHAQEFSFSLVFTYVF